MANKPIVKVKINNTTIVETPQVLETVCEQVTSFTPEVKKLIADLLDTVRQPENKAAGLSASQLGDTKRVCVVRRFREDPEDPEKDIAFDIVLINPEITSFSPQTDVRWEACLSVPGLFGKVERAKRVKVRALNEKGQPIKLKASGFFARVIQHELDHLNGILFTTKAIGKIITEEELDRLIEQEQKNQAELQTGL